MHKQLINALQQLVKCHDAFNTAKGELDSRDQQYLQRIGLNQASYRLSIINDSFHGIYYETRNKLRNAEPDFNPIQLSIEQLEWYNEVTGGASERMVKQLELRRLLAVIDRYKNDFSLVFDTKTNKEWLCPL